MISPSYLMSSSTIEQMVDNMVLNQGLKEVQEHKKHIPPEAFLREFQTVKVHLPRASGHSTAAAHLWRGYKALVMFPKQLHADMFMREVLGRKMGEIITNRNDCVQTRCMSFGSTAEISHLPERLLPFGNLPERELPQLLVFDMASWFGEPWRTSRNEARELKRRLDEAIRWGSDTDVQHLFDRALRGSQHPDKIIDQITQITFARIPTLKGVVVLQ